MAKLQAPYYEPCGVRTVHGWSKKRLVIGPERLHNKTGIDLRQTPVCYLCGGQWERIKMLGFKTRLLICIQCKQCGVRSLAKRDEQVIEARKWSWTN
jgi:hypothetical protein